MIKKLDKKSYRWSALGIAAIMGVSTFSLMNVQASVTSSNNKQTQNLESNKQQRKSQIEEVNEIKQLDQKSVPELSLIFDQYVKEGKSTDEIVRIINERGKENKTSYIVLTILDSDTGEIKYRHISKPAAINLTEKQKEYLKSKGIPTKQTAEEGESTGIQLVFPPNLGENGDGKSHNEKFDIINRGEFEKKYAGTSNTIYSAWE
ncbi:hypothetical protein [Bacillus thuringiensis]|uniref:hypothetical protein n=1 Tax=Bacillus thuringiensis TaxID=1428 RepID=UPI0030192D48